MTCFLLFARQTDNQRITVIKILNSFVAIRM